LAVNLGIKMKPFLWTIFLIVIVACSAVEMFSPWLGLGEKFDVFLYRSFGVPWTLTLSLLLLPIFLLILYEILEIGVETPVRKFRFLAPCNAAWSNVISITRTLKIAVRQLLSSFRISAQRRDAVTGWIPAIDGLRAIAVLLVLYHHVFDSIYALGNIGVAIFFAISGFLAYWVLHRDETKLGRIDYNYFLFRRVLRIWPGYLIVIAVILAITMWRDGIPPDCNIWSLFTFSSNLEMATWRPWPPSELAIYWTIAVEEQFYLLAPLMYLALRSRWPLYFCIAIVIASNAARIGYLANFMEPDHSYGPSPGNGGLYYMSYSYADTFLAGAIVAHLKVKNHLTDRWHLPLLICAAFLWVWIAKYWAYSAFPPYRSYTALIYALLPLGGALLLVSIVQGIDSWWTATLISWPMCYIGRLSYSLYLVHLSVIIWITNWWPAILTSPGLHIATWSGPYIVTFFYSLIVFGIFGIAMALHLGIERQFLKLKSRSVTTAALYPAPVVLTVSAVGAGIVLYWLR
jgi:peptidoglycan/LPS O-acetylase OafA/YrhL